MSDEGPPAARALPPPSPDEWRRLEPLVDAVLDTPPGERGALISVLSGGDPTREAELARLVTECERSYTPLDRPPAERFAGVLEDETPSMPETLAGRYRIEREVGRGGMAIVYLAHDLRHGRDVAVKVVRPELAAALGRARFLREIEIAARLRHPHIVPVYDSGEVPDELDPDGASLLYYVMPYEVGRSLRDRLARDGPLPVDDAVAVVRDVCDALAHAHQHGIVHRDVKPDNVLLSGRHALVTDFGVARALSEAAGASGAAVGTPAYMAPEQADNASDVDHLADVYAVGVLAYELLAGRTPSVGRAARPVPDETAGALPDDAPGALPDEARDAVRDVARELTRLRPDVPAALAGVIATCLATRPADRWQSADDLRERISASTAVASSATVRSTPARAPRRRAAPMAAVIGGVALVASLAMLAAARIHARDGRTERAALDLGRAVQLTSEHGLEVQPAMSPDGRTVAYAAGHSRRLRVALRPATGGRARWLTADTLENQWLPRWSPDGARILFLTERGVVSVSATGGATRVEVPSRPRAVIKSATWSPDGREIAYVLGDSLIARTVGTGRTRLIAIGRDLHSCRWSPDGVRLACVSGNSFYVTPGASAGTGVMFGNLAPSRIVLIPAAGGRPVSVTDSGSLHQSPAWSPDGRTLYYASNRQGPRDVYALDVHALDATGRAAPRVEPMRVTTGMSAHSIDFSADGTRMVYAAYVSSANVWALPIPQRGPVSSEAAVPVTSGNQTVEGVRVSPDGRWLVYDSDLSGSSDVYRVPVGGGDAERLTRGPAEAFRGTLSPDGRELVYHSFQTGSRNLFLLSLGGGTTRQLTHSSQQLSMANWSPDGRALTLFDMATDRVLVMRRDARGRWGAPRFVGARGWRAEWAPDGRTLAFISPHDGRIGIVPADSGASRDVYVPRAGEPMAELALFAASGRELYFKSHDAQGRATFWSAPVAGGRPRLLVRFDAPARASNRFDFASDGRRFYFTIEDRQSDVWVAEVAHR